MPILAKAARNAFTIIRPSGPDFSGVTGQIDHRVISGQKMTEAGALRVAAVWIANTVLADEVSSLTLKIVAKDDKERQPLEPPRLKALWDDPNPDQTRMGIDATEVLSMGLWGASYTMLGWTRSGSLDVRWPIDPSVVKLERMPDMGLKLTASGQGELTNRPNDRPEFAYVPLYTLPGQLMPVSPVRMAAELAGLSLAYQETAAKFMGRGLNPSAILTVGEFVPETTAKMLADELMRTVGGSGKAGGVAVVGGKDLKVERMTMSMADAEFIAQNEYVFKVLLAMWRVPPTVAGMVDKPSTWGTGVAEFSRGLERFTLRPIVQRRQAAHEKYITRWEDRNLQVRYKFDSLLSSSPRERTEIQQMRLNAGMTSVERVLAQEDEPPFGEEDTIFSALSQTTEEERDLRNIQRKADAATALQRAGVERSASFEQVGLEAVEAEISEAATAAALNGAQLESLLEIVRQVTTGGLAPEAAKAMIGAAFPAMTEEQIDTIVDASAAFTPTTSEG